MLVSTSLTHYAIYQYEFSIISINWRQQVDTIGIWSGIRRKFNVKLTASVLDAPSTEHLASICFWQLPRLSYFCARQLSTCWTALAIVLSRKLTNPQVSSLCFLTTAHAHRLESQYIVFLQYWRLPFPVPCVSDTLSMVNLFWVKSLLLSCFLLYYV